MKNDDEAICFEPRRRKERQMIKVSDRKLENSESRNLSKPETCALLARRAALSTTHMICEAMKS